MAIFNKEAILFKDGVCIFLTKTLHCFKKIKRNYLKNESKAKIAFPSNFSFLPSFVFFEKNKVIVKFCFVRPNH